MYNNGYANSLQYILNQEPKKTTKQSYPAVGISRQKIYAAKYQQQDFMLVGLEIDFMVTN